MRDILITHCFESFHFFISGVREIVLFADSNNIMEFDVDTRNVTVLFVHAGLEVNAMDYDYRNRYVYFPRYSRHDIMRYGYLLTLKLYKYTLFKICMTKYEGMFRCNILLQCLEDSVWHLESKNASQLKRQSNIMSKGIPAYWISLTQYQLEVRLNLLKSYETANENKMMHFFFFIKMNGFHSKTYFPYSKWPPHNNLVIAIRIDLS